MASADLEKNLVNYVRTSKRFAVHGYVEVKIG